MTDEIRHYLPLLSEKHLHCSVELMMKLMSVSSESSCISLNSTTACISVSAQTSIGNSNTRADGRNRNGSITLCTHKSSHAGLLEESNISVMSG